MLFGIRSIETGFTPETPDTTYMLHSEIEGLDEIYNEINQAKAAKHDDAEADFSIWDENLRRRPSDWKTDWCIVGQEHDHCYEKKFFNNLRDAQHNVFSRRVKDSFTRYMVKTYQNECAFTKTDRAMLTMNEVWEKERDEAAGLEALNKTKQSTFWEWNNGSFPYF